MQQPTKRFCNFLQKGVAKNTFGKTETEIFNKLTSISLSGGTKQDLGLDAARKSGLYSTSNTNKQIAILITDGAPNNTTWSSITTAANNIKGLTNANGENLLLYTLGISLSDVGDNASKLNNISSGSGYHYQADDGAAIVAAIEDIIESLMRKATLQGTVTDTIDSAFYPIDSDGNPIVSGTTVNGATYTYNSSADTWTVTWADQDIEWPATEPDGSITPGWHEKIYVKAKEDYLGGNTINTNIGSNDQVVSTKFKTTSGTYKDITSTDDNGNTVNITYSVTLNPPSVNVNELSFTENSTEWTVYLGSSVDPLEELKRLYDSVLVNEVVTSTVDADADGTGDHKYNNGEMIGESSDSSEQFPLKEITGELDWNKLLANGKIEINYSAYHDSGKIVIELIKSIADGEPDLSQDAHDTAVLGGGVERYTLMASYLPYEKDTTVNYRTGSYYSGQEGDATDGIESINDHVINVYVKGLQITKMNQSFENNLTGAEFKLYRTARTGETENLLTISGTNYYPVAVLDMSSESTVTIDQVAALKTGESYYLVH